MNELFTAGSEFWRPENRKQANTSKFSFKEFKYQTQESGFWFFEQFRLNFWAMGQKPDHCAWYFYVV